MEYIEYVRARRIFAIYAIVCTVVVVAVDLSIRTAALGGHGMTITFGDDAGAPRGPATGASFARARVPLGFVLGMAGYAAIVFATVLASSLNAQRAYAHFSFVKPLSRERLGLAFMAVDAVAIVAAFAFAATLVALAVAALGDVAHVFVDREALAIGALGLGLAFMWYGLLQAVTAPYAGNGGVLVGMSWPVFIVLPLLGGVTALGPAFARVVHVLEFFDPIAYFSTLASAPDGASAVAHSLLGIALPLRVALAWSIALVACAVALAAWKRVEVVS